MFKAYIGSSPLFDPDLNIGLESAELELSANSAGSFTFVIYWDHGLYGTIQKSLLASPVKVTQDDQTIWQGRIKSVYQRFDKSYEVECFGELEFLNQTIQRQAEYHDMTVRGYLERMIEIHNEQVDDSKKFAVGMVTVTDNNDSLYRYTNNNSTWDEIKDDLIDDLGGYLRIRYQDGKRYLDYIKDCPRTCDQAIEFGLNLLDYTEDLDASEIATVVIPLGAKQEKSDIEALEKRLDIKSVNNGKDYLEITEAVQSFGRITKVVTWDGVHTASALKTKAQKWLEDAQFADLTLELSAVDLADFGLNPDHMQLLDSIVCTSEPHGMNRRFPLTKMALDLTDPAGHTFTLGSKLKSYVKSQTKATYSITQLIDQTPTTNKLIQEAINNATALITAAGKGGHVVFNPDLTKPEEILIMDMIEIETATRVWRWNVNGLGYSNNGYNGPFETAITMDGTIVGKFLAANSIAAEKLSVDYRKSVEDGISLAESNANSYTDEKIKYLEVDYTTKFTVVDGQITGLIEKQASDVKQLQADAKAAMDKANEAYAHGENYYNENITNYYQKTEVDQTVEHINQTVAGGLETVTNSVTTLRSDAQKMADDAKADAISTASKDATTKADAAKADAAEKVEALKDELTPKIATLNKNLTGLNDSLTEAINEVSDKVTTQTAQTLADAKSYTVTQLSSYSKSSDVQSWINESKEKIEQGVEGKYETKGNVQTKIDAVLADGKTYTNNQLLNYSTTADVETLIQQTETAINTGISATYATQASLTEKVNGVLSKFNSYSTTTEYQTWVNQKIGEVNIGVDKLVDRVNSAGNRNFLQNSSGNVLTNQYDSSGKFTRYVRTSGWKSTASTNGGGAGFREILTGRGPCLFINRTSANSTSTTNRVLMYNDSATERLQTLSEGQKFVISGWYYVQKGVTLTGNADVCFRIYNQSNVATDFLAVRVTTSDTDWMGVWRRFELPFELPYDGSEIRTAQFFLALSAYGDLSVTEVKLETGSTASAWCPAVEDMDIKTSSIYEKAEIDVKLNEISLSVVNESKTYTTNQLKNYSTTSTYQSWVNLKLDEVRLGLESKVTNSVQLAGNRNLLQNSTANVKRNVYNSSGTLTSTNRMMRWATTSTESDVGGSCGYRELMSGKGPIIWLYRSSSNSTSTSKRTLVYNASATERFQSLSKGSKFTVSGWYYVTNGTNTSGSSSIKLTGNADITVRFINTSDVSYDCNCVRVTSTETDRMGSWRRFEQTFETPIEGSATKTVQFFSAIEKYGYIAFNNVKIELGTSASAWCAAHEDVDLKTSTIYEKAEIDVKLGAITSEVSKKVTSGEVTTLTGTWFQQNYLQFIYKWNEYSDYITLEQASLNILDSSGKPKLKLYKQGLALWFGDYKVGNIGTNYWAINSNVRGVNFDLAYDGSFMGWAYQESENAETNSWKWVYTAKSEIDGYAANQIHAGCEIDMHNYATWNGKYHGRHFSSDHHQGVTKSDGNVYLPTKVNSDGTLGGWIVLMLRDGLLCRE